jgi:hypothetical protein
MDVGKTTGRLPCGHGRRREISAMQCHAFWMPRQGCADHEYEDALAFDAERGRLAIADGATESWLAREWAQALVQAFVTLEGSPMADWEAQFPRLCQTWTAAVGRGDNDRETPYFRAEKLDEGAHAAFLGIELERRAPGEGLWWHGVAIGDGCLVQIRGNHLVHSFPLEDASQFDNHPELAGSRGPGAPRWRHAQGRLHAGDWLLLMTDALACWLLRDQVNSRAGWKALRSLLERQASQPELATFVNRLRDQHRLANDDVTLIAARF